jgi:pimeloyl-ACP methyl ester carboxylesterase
MMNGDSMLPWSLQLAESGYRVVTLDLRNHGQSGTGPSGYGTYESDDVVDVISELRARGEVTGPLYLFGVSYGAATAVFTAEKLGDQVEGVVAMESFANAGVAIRTMIPHLMGLQPEGLKAQAVASYARWRYGGQDINQVIAAASRRIDVDLDRVDVGQSARALHRDARRGPHHPAAAAGSAGRSGRRLDGARRAPSAKRLPGTATAGPGRVADAQLRKGDGGD